MKIMFICTGNTCRSAMARAMLEKKIKSANKDIQVYSSGIFAQNGDIATREAIITMEKYDIDLRNHRATNIINSNIKEMDIILCATLLNKRDVLNMYPELKEKVFTIKEYADLVKKGNNYDIVDPWGCDINIYIKCAKEIEDCINKILEKLK